MSTPGLTDPQCVYTHRDLTLTLKPRRYRAPNGALADLRDDGIIDYVAVDRFVDGDPARITSREVVCVIARLAHAGQTDAEIAERFGRGTRDAILKVRHRAGIPAAEQPLNEEALNRLIVEPSQRGSRSARAIRAAGLDENTVAKITARHAIAA